MSVIRNAALLASLLLLAACAARSAQVERDVAAIVQGMEHGAAATVAAGMPKAGIPTPQSRDGTAPRRD